MLCVVELIVIFIAHGQPIPMNKLSCHQKTFRVSRVLPVPQLSEAHWKLLDWDLGITMETQLPPLVKPTPGISYKDLPRVSPKRLHSI